MNPSKKHGVRKLTETSWLLQRGEQLQVTKLLPISKLIDGNYSCSQYYVFLVNESRKLYENGESLSQVKLIKESQKSEIYKRAAFLLKAVNQNDGIIEHGKDIIDLYNEIYGISNGWKRVSIHATRRKIEDPDLALVEQTIRFVLNHWHEGMYAYMLSQYFCCDYKGYRFSLKKSSAKRVMTIAEYFSNRHLDRSVRLAW